MEKEDCPRFPYSLKNRDGKMYFCVNFSADTCLHARWGQGGGGARGEQAFKLIEVAGGERGGL